MKKAKRWRYYCDFCKKAGGHAGHMTRHEISCTANPDRKCNMCDAGDLLQKDIEVLSAPLKELGEIAFDDYMGSERATAAVEKLHGLAEGCPACMLAAVRQNDAFGVNFNYKESLKIFWDAVNEANSNESMYADYRY